MAFEHLADSGAVPPMFKESMPVSFGRVKARIYGGRYKNYVPDTRRLVGVKMAAEIEHPCEVSIPTEDFSIPDTRDMVSGMMAALLAIHDGNDVYAGCMGGSGRTGLFMGCMAKLMKDYGETGIKDPVTYVRATYRSHAIETSEQEAFVRTFDTTKLVKYIDELQGVKRIVRVAEVVVMRDRYLSPWQWVKHTFGFPIDKP